jgi:hypothetical protein
VVVRNQYIERHSNIKINRETRPTRDMETLRRLALCLCLDGDAGVGFDEGSSSMSSSDLRRV